MSALYAFCREVDDVADDESRPADERRTRLAAWRTDVRLACDDASPEFGVNQELQQFIRQYRLRFELFDDLIRGVEMDLDIKRYEDYPALELYCYRVASVVGLLSIEIFGYTDPGCRDYAVHLGKALQLTNILRDVRTDAERGRIYLPQSELKRFNVSEEEILGGIYTDRFRELAARAASRAREHYQLAREKLPAADRRSMATAELMGAVYWRLLRKLEANQFRVLAEPPTRLTKGQKLTLIARTWLRFAFGATTPNYGAP